MSNKIKVDLETALKFASNGFEIECFVLSPEPVSKPRKKFKKRNFHNRNRTVNNNEKIRLCRNQDPPLSGKIAEAWQLVKPELFPNKDSVVTVGEFRNLMTELGSDRTASYYLMYTRPCIELIEQQPKLL